MTKKMKFCTNVTSHGEAAKQNGCGMKISYWVVGTVYVLMVYHTYLPIIINVTLNLPKLL